MKKIYLFLTVLASSICGSQNLAVTAFATGFSNPVEIVNAGDDRLFVVQLGGSIRILNADGSINATPFINLSSIITSGGERGLLGLAFHPDFATNGYFYVNYTRSGDGATTIARYTVSADPDIADATSAQVLLTVSQPYSNHNGGSIHFGPDGYLYIGMGDGGSGGDPGNRAQNLNENLGKMLRIDVDSATPYGIPADNPYVGIAGNDEIFHYGLRNPWKFSFDKENGDLWIADVGQNEVEEINHLTAPLASGLNLGWRCYEGSEPYNTAGCAAIGTMTMPVTEYTHSGTGGCSITGGYVYRGSLYPSLSGLYIFADYCIGELATFNGSGAPVFTSDLNFAGLITTFGQDAAGELYVAGGGTIYKISDPTMSTGDFATHNMALYPNPTSGQVFLNAPVEIFPAKLQLFDQAGRSIWNGVMQAPSADAIALPGVNSGLYLVELTDQNGKRYNSKLIIR